MAKVVYNACFGGFGLSDAAIRRYAELKGITLYPEGERLNVTYFTVPPEQRKGKWGDEVLYDHDLERDDPVLVQVVEELGDKANGMCAKLRIEEMPDGTPYRIDEYDGSETVITASAQAWRIAGAKR